VQPRIPFILLDPFQLRPTVAVPYGGVSMRRRSGQALTEFAVLYAGVVLPLTFQ